MMTALLSLAIFTTAVAKPHLLPGADIPISSRVSVDYHYIDLGKSFTYETGFGRVDVTSAGSAASVRARVSRSLDLGFTYFDFDVDASFMGTQVGDSTARAGLFRLNKRFSINGTDADLGYGYLDNSSISGVHILSLTHTRNAYGVDWTGGISAWGGGAADESAGVFAGITWRPAPELALFAQYDSADFLKAFQCFVIAPAARNIGTVNTSSAPKDVFTMGITGRVLDTVNVTFAVYDVDVQMQPVLGISYSR
jgi:hypothetical protein